MEKQTELLTHKANVTPTILSIDRKRAFQCSTERRQRDREGSRESKKNKGKKEKPQNRFKSRIRFKEKGQISSPRQKNPQD